MSGALILAALLASAHFLPAIGIWVVLVAISSLAQLEFYTMINMPGIPVFRLLGLCSGAALITATFVAIGPDPGAVALAYEWEHAILLGSFLAVFVRQFPQKRNDQPLPTVACTLLGILYVPYLFNFFTRIVFAWSAEGNETEIMHTGRQVALYLIVVVKSSDMGAYFAGTAFGRHKLFPRISPGKTWEGGLAGILTSVLVSVGFYVAAGRRLGALQLGLHDAILLGVLLAVVGGAGDIFESLLKRAAGAKDSGRVIPGMGGILDVLDSLLFAAPAMWVYIRLVLKP
jgi:phosphatidate cytidylyltransferase